MEQENSLASPALVAASSSWAFALGTIYHPVRELPRQAKRRGVEVTDAGLRELWRTGRVRPFVEIRRAGSGAARPQVASEPDHASTWTYVVRAARRDGRLADPNERGYRSGVRFDVSADDAWHGRRLAFLYSRWQLTELRWAKALTDALQRRHPRPMRPLETWERTLAEHSHRRTELLVALESRYLPEIASPWVHLTHATVEEWHAYCDTFDPLAAIESVGWAKQDLASAGDRLLSMARSIDPVKGRLSAVVKRAGRQAWKELEGDALVAHDLRSAAEVILRCLDELPAPAEPVPLRERVHLKDHRLSSREEPLDRVLSRAGLSPHPRSVLIVEGETEEILAPRVREVIRMPLDAQTLRIINVRGTKGDLAKLVSALAAPMIAERQWQDDRIDLERPPTFVLIAMDPENNYAPDKIDRTVAKMVDELERVVRAQGYAADRSELEDLVSARTWSSSCFEFAHFDDDELAVAIAAVVPIESVPELATALARQRAAGMDISQTWKKWKVQPSKTDLADELWPTLRSKILAAEHDPSAPFPEIAQRIVEAYDMGSHVGAGSYAMSPDPNDDSEPTRPEI